MILRPEQILLMRLGLPIVPANDMGKSDPPPPPDYAAAARAQGGANLQSTIAGNIMNRPNEITPLGSRRWRQTGTQVIPAAEGNPEVSVPTWESQIDLTPLGQQRFAQEQRITGTLGNVAETGLNRVGDAVSQQFDTQSLPQVAAIPGMNQAMPRFASDGGIDRTMRWADRPDESGMNPGQRGPGMPLPGMNPGLPVQGQMPQRTPDITQVPNQSNIGDTLYQAQTRYMDPQFQQQESQLENKLVNQGLQRGTEAFDTAMRNFVMDRERAYADARDRATLASGQEQSRQFGLGAQQFAQGAQNFGMGLAGQGQDFGQQAQRYQLGMAGGNQAFNQRMQEQAQRFGQQAQTYGLSAQERQRALQEQAYMRQLPLNELNALRTGSQVSMPQFQPFATGMVQPAPLMQGTQLQGQADQNLYNAQQAGSGSFLSGLFQLGSAALPYMI